MKINEKQYSKGVECGIIDTKKFKTDYFCLSYTLPMTEYNISAASVLAFVISRGTQKHKTLLDINRHLVSLYDADTSVYVSKSAGGLTFRISAAMLDSVYATDGCDVFGGTLDFIREILFAPLAVDGELNDEYTASEKKRAYDRIDAEINNKDRFALQRANALAYADTPFALSENGTKQCIDGITPSSLYEMLTFITTGCPAQAVFAGNYTEQKAHSLDKFLYEIAQKNNGARLSQTENKLPCFDKAVAVAEEVAAKQGRMVLNFDIGKRAYTDAAPMIFDEIFGASPVSRLFANVRERMSLCYYCASSYIMPLGAVIIRSGLDKDNAPKAKEEIQRQIKLLSEPENITDEELDTAKISRISVYKALSDSTSRYADWYLSRRLMGAPADIEQMISAINAVTKEDVAAVAKNMRLRLDYFLDGKED